jgi:hypothetical protein
MKWVAADDRRNAFSFAMHLIVTFCVDQAASDLTDVTR